MDLNIDIKKYMLDSYDAAKLADRTLEVVYTDNQSEDVHCTRYIHAQQKCSLLTFPFARSGLEYVSIIRAHTLTEQEEDPDTKKILEISLDVSHISNMEYEPGDTIGILPRNAKVEVEQLLHILHLEEKAQSKCQVQVLTSCTKKNVKVPPYIPSITTPYELLSDCLNLRAVPKKQFMRVLAEYCANTEQRDFLCSLSSKDGSSHYNELILETGLKLLDLLKICASCRPPLEVLIEHLPRLLPRPYSIANSPTKSANEIQIICSVLPERPGVTTSMLEQLIKQVDRPSEPPLNVCMYLREYNDFRYTSKDASSNQILIAIGTGLAPFLGFLDYKQHLHDGQNQVELGETWLFAGAKNEASLLHRDHLLQLHDEGVLNNYFESFSRNPMARFQYVQEQMLANVREFVSFLLRPNTFLYVCADGTIISKTIEDAVVACLTEELKLKETDILDIIKEFRANGKYREDLWT